MLDAGRLVEARLRVAFNLSSVPLASRPKATGIGLRSVEKESHMGNPS
jgi:hypothetical protein